uniref:Uncharacterized protein n=1 Tax=Octopus bimaculoides TaxID=37653 RepID=A0A0L8HT61_OCTBM
MHLEKMGSMHDNVPCCTYEQTILTSNDHVRLILSVAHALFTAGISYCSSLQWFIAIVYCCSSLLWFTNVV